MINDDMVHLISELEITIRDQFAMAALTGYLSSRMDGAFPSPTATAKACYVFADEMMEVRKR